MLSRVINVNTGKCCLIDNFNKKCPFYNKGLCNYYERTTFYADELFCQVKQIVVNYDDEIRFDLAPHLRNTLAEYSKYMSKDQMKKVVDEL